MGLFRSATIARACELANYAQVVLAEIKGLVFRTPHPSRFSAKGGVFSPPRTLNQNHRLPGQIKSLPAYWPLILGGRKNVACIPRTYSHMGSPSSSSHQSSSGSSS
jgi:hypothetical protein